MWLVSRNRDEKAAESPTNSTLRKKKKKGFGTLIGSEPKTATKLPCSGAVVSLSTATTFSPVRASLAVDCSCCVAGNCAAVENCVF